MKGEKAAMLTIETPSPTVSFNFNKKLKAPADFKNLTINGSVKVLVSGKVKSISQGKNYDNEPYQDFSVEIESVDIESRDPKNLKEARSLAAKKAGG